MEATWNRLGKYNVKLKSFKIRSAMSQSNRREEFNIWSSKSACKTLEEICVYNTHVSCFSPKVPLVIFSRLKSVRIKMNRDYWRQRSGYGQINPLINGTDLQYNHRYQTGRRVSLIDNCPSLENLSIKFLFTPASSRTFRNTSLKRKLQVIIFYLGIDKSTRLY